VPGLVVCRHGPLPLPLSRGISIAHRPRFAPRKKAAKELEAPETTRARGNKTGCCERIDSDGQVLTMRQGAGGAISERIKGGELSET
jgi:hypothetical protein